MLKMGIVFILMAIAVWYQTEQIEALQKRVLSLEQDKDDCNEQIKDILLNRQIIRAQIKYHENTRQDQTTYAQPVEKHSGRSGDSRNDRHGRNRFSDVWSFCISESGSGRDRSARYYSGGGFG